jgi:hypothetical protein
MNMFLRDTFGLLSGTVCVGEYSLVSTYREVCS